jgi:hypothetical protein
MHQSLKSDVSINLNKYVDAYEANGILKWCWHFRLVLGRVQTDELIRVVCSFGALKVWYEQLDWNIQQKDTRQNDNLQSDSPQRCI